MCTVSSAQMLQSALPECITAAEWKALITKARLAAAVRELFFKSVISKNFQSLLRGLYPDVFSNSNFEFNVNYWQYTETIYN